MKAKVREYVKNMYGWMVNDVEKYVCKNAETRAKCSCYMCGNPRKYSKDKLTHQELKAILDNQWEM